MKLHFHWIEVKYPNRDTASLWPFCDSDVVGADGSSPLCCILTDDGGLGRESALEWRLTALSRIEAAMRGEAAVIDWSTECFCSDIGREVVKIYMDRCEDSAQLVPTGAFKRAIEASIEFFRMPVSLESRLELEV